MWRYLAPAICSFLLSSMVTVPYAQAGPSGQVMVHVKDAITKRPLSGLLVVLVVNGSAYVERLVGGSCLFSIPEGGDAELYAPVLDERRVYVPERHLIGPVSSDKRLEVSLSLFPGAIVEIAGNVPPVEGELPFDMLFSVQVHNVAEEPEWILKYGKLSPYSLDVLGIDEDVVIVPAHQGAISASVQIDARAVLPDGQGLELSWSPDDYGGFFALSRGGTERVSLLRVISQRNLEVALERFAAAREALTSAERYGFYLGFEAERARRAEGLLRDSADLLTHGQYFEALGKIKLAYLSSEATLSSVSEMYSEAGASIPALSLFMALLAVGVGQFLEEDKDKQLLLTVACFGLLFVAFFFLYPGFRFAYTPEYLIAIYVVFIMFTIVFLIPEYVREGRTGGGIAFIGALVMSLSLAKRSLRRRRLRALLTFLSLATLVFAFTCLSSITLEFGATPVTARALHPLEVVNMVSVERVGRPFQPISLSEVAWISEQAGAQLMGVRVENLPTVGPVGSLRSDSGSYDVFGFLGLSPGDPNAPKIAEMLVEGEDAARVFSSEGLLLVSDEAARALNLGPGDSVRFMGSSFQIAGVFDKAMLYEARDVDIDPLPPWTISRSTGSLVFSGDVITSCQTALRLGGVVSKVYLKVRRPEALYDVAHRTCLLGGYYTRALDGDNTIQGYYMGRALMLTGTALIVVLAIAVLNIGLVMLSAIFERKGEMSILSSLGLTPSHVAYLFMAEAAVLALLSAGIGFTFGILGFKMLSLASVPIPVNIKVSPGDFFAVILLAVGVAVLSSAIPALKASVMVTPSLLRKWKMEGAVKRGTWTIGIPVRVPLERGDHFLRYLTERLNEYRLGLTINVDNVRVESRVAHGVEGRHLFFRFGRGGNRPFVADCGLALRPERGAWRVSLDVKPLSVYPGFAESYVHEVGSLIRQLSLQWSSRGLRIAIPMERDPRFLYKLIKAYYPHRILVLCREDRARTIRELKERLAREGSLVPAITQRVVRIDDLARAMAQTVRETKEADLLCLTSDDSVLSALLFNAAAKTGKRVCFLSEDEFKEFRVGG